MINFVILQGRLTADPDVKITSRENTVANFSLAVQRDGPADRAGVDFVDISAWEKVAEIVRDNCFKGDKIIIFGRLRQSRWTDNSGATKTRLQVAATKIYFDGSKDRMDNITTPDNSVPSYYGDGPQFVDYEDDIPMDF